MKKSSKYIGDVSSFSRNWEIRSETKNNYFSRGAVQNQIQLAYRQHWSFIKEVVKIPARGRSLEVGCGRGSVSSYFAENGYRVTLLDTSSAVLEAAQTIFANNRHKNAEFVCGNAMHLPFKDNSFDVTISMGLLEHFRDPRMVISEQIRVLKKDGIFIGYVVPEKKTYVQQLFSPVNALLKELFKAHPGSKKKERIFRNDFGIKRYINWLKRFQVRRIGASGVYPFPAISHSPDFPFSLMPAKFEKALVESYQNILKIRRNNNKVHPWVCEEKWGQSFFVWATKK